MALSLDPEFRAGWLGIVIFHLSPAGDNALVIALAVQTLPPRERFLGKIVHGGIEPWAGALHWSVPAAPRVVLTVVGWWPARRARFSAPGQVGTSKSAG